MRSQFLLISIILIFLAFVISKKHLRVAEDNQIKSMSFQLERTESPGDDGGKVSNEDGGEVSNENEGDDANKNVGDDAKSDDYKAMSEELTKLKADSSGDAYDAYYYQEGESNSEESESDAEIAGAAAESDDAVSSVRRYLQGRFDVFKSYANAQVKPPQYLKTSVKHSIDEYLSPNQKYMMQKRHGPDDPNNSFGADWSGFNKEKN
jgi:hypothetical protein